MDFIFLDLKVVVQWVDHLLILKKTKKKLFLLVPQIKVNYSFVIGLLEVLIKVVVKMIPFFNIGTIKEILDLLLL